MLDKLAQLDKKAEKKEHRKKKKEEPVPSHGQQKTFVIPPSQIIKSAPVTKPEKPLADPTLITDASHSDANTLFRPGADKITVQTQKNTIAKVRSSPASFTAQSKKEESYNDEVIKQLAKRYLDNDPKED